MHPEFASVVQKQTDIQSKELTPNEIYNLFKKEYLMNNNNYKLGKYKIETTEENEVCLEATVTIDGDKKLINSTGNGPISAFLNGLKENGYADYSICNYAEHSLETGANAMAIAYVQVADSKGNKCYGVGVDSNIDSASIKAILSSISRIKS